MAGRYLEVKFKISDDSGFLAIFNPAKYSSFVGGEWELDELLNHFEDQIKEKNLLIWGTGGFGDYEVEIRSGMTAFEGFRSVTGTIGVSEGVLYLINYESLTMGAQFEDIKLPEKHLADLAIPLENGAYNCRIIQVNNPYQYSSNDHADFILELEKCGGKTFERDQIPWFIR